MSDKSTIEWTDASWNPLTGCTKVSPGCDHCYAERIVERFQGKGAFATVRYADSKLDIPLRWRKPRRVFVNSMSDLFHDDIPDEFVAKVFAVMALAERHVFQVLTKRHGRLRSLLRSGAFGETVQRYAVPFARLYGINTTWAARVSDPRSLPPPNIWLGVSVEDQKWADIRIPALLETPAAVRWLSCEPLLGPIDLTNVAPGTVYINAGFNALATAPGHLDWIVVGGESGPGARPMHPDWARSLRDQCVNAKVPYFFKQWGEFLPLRPGEEGDAPFLIVPEYGWSLKGSFTRGASMRRVGKKRAGRSLDGRTWDEYPVGPS